MARRIEREQCSSRAMIAPRTYRLGRRITRNCLKMWEYSCEAVVQ